MYGILKTGKSENCNFVKRIMEFLPNYLSLPQQQNTSPALVAVQMIISSFLEYLNFLPLDYNLGESKKTIQAKFYKVLSP